MEPNVHPPLRAYPGPYRVATSAGKPVNPTEPDGYEVVIARDGTHLIDVDMPYIHQALVPGTAVLLAAAPLLRQLLRQFVEVLETGGVPSQELAVAAHDVLDALPPEASSQEVADLETQPLE